MLDYNYNAHNLVVNDKTSVLDNLARDIDIALLFMFILNRYSISQSLI